MMLSGAVIEESAIYYGDNEKDFISNGTLTQLIPSLKKWLHQGTKDQNFHVAPP